MVFKSKIVNNTTLEAEYSYSKTNDTEGSGFRIEAITKYDKWFSNLNFIHTTPNYNGYFRNTTNFNGSIGYLLSSKVDISINHFQDAKNFQRDTLFLAAPYRRFTQLALNYRYSKNGYLNIFNGYMRNVDRMTPNLFKYDELFFRINISQKVGFFEFGLDNQFGNTKNHLTNTEGKTNFHQFNLIFSKFNIYTNIFASIANTSRYNGTSNTKNFYFGGRISKYFTDKTNFNIFYQNNYIPEDYFKDRNQFEGSIRHTLHHNHSIELSGRYTLQRGQLDNKDFIVALKYLAQINIPIKKIAQYTTLTGTISTSNEESIQGIRIQLGDQIAITDKNGSYKFKNIVPGNYYLDIDKSSLPLNAITNIALPKAMNIENAPFTQQNFEIKKAAKIIGTIKIMDIISNKIFSEDRKKLLASTLIIEAKSENQTIRKICQLSDDFDFTYLIPGPWKIKIYANTLSNTYKIVNDYFDLELKEGESKNMVIEIKSNQKEIRFQQETIQVGYSHP